MKRLFISLLAIGMVAGVSASPPDGTALVEKLDTSSELQDVLTTTSGLSSITDTTDGVQLDGGASLTSSGLSYDGNITYFEAGMPTDTEIYFDGESIDFNNQYQWTDPVDPTGIKILDTNGVEITYIELYSPDNEKPTLNSFSLSDSNGDGVVSEGETFNIEVNASDNNGVNSVTAQFNGDGFKVDLTKENGVWTYSNTRNSLIIHDVTLTIKDSAGNTRTVNKEVTPSFPTTAEKYRLFDASTDSELSNWFEELSNATLNGSVIFQNQTGTGTTQKFEVQTHDHLETNVNLSDGAVMNLTVQTFVNGTVNETKTFTVADGSNSFGVGSLDKTVTRLKFEGDNLTDSEIKSLSYYGTLSESTIVGAITDLSGSATGFVDSILNSISNAFNDVFDGIDGLINDVVGAITP